MIDIRFNKETQAFERVEAFTKDQIVSQLQTWQGLVDQKNAEIATLTGQIQELQDLINGSGL